MRVNLVNNGVFPIVKDINGNSISDIPDTGFLISGTAQGEGKLTGIPCLFVRFSGCNLLCSWIGADGKGSPCDTLYSSHKPEKNKVEVEDIIKLLNANRGNINHVVVSGGEPTLQTEGLILLLKRLRSEGYHTTVETNATLYDDDIANYTNLISMSPKLRTSTPWKDNLKGTDLEYDDKRVRKHDRDRKNIKVIQKYIDSCHPTSGTFDTPTYQIYYNERYRTRDFQLKFVVSSPEDIIEIENDFLVYLKGWNPEDIILMPEGVTPEDLMSKGNWVVEECIKKGWRFNQRLHALLFGVKRGV